MKFERVLLNVCALIAFLFIISKLCNIIKFLICKFRGDKSSFKDFFRKEICVVKFNLLDNKKANDILFGIILIIGIFGLYVDAASHYGFGSTTIGALDEKASYEEQYYVLLYPDNEKIVNLKIPATIRSEIREYDEEHSRREYYIQEAFFEDGSSVKFWNNGFDSPLQLEQQISIEDDEGQVWGIELTKQKVN